MATPVTVSALICLLLAGALVRARLLYQDAMRRAEADRAQTAELTRLARLTAADLRATALCLLGHADAMPGHLQTSLLAAEASLRELAEALLRQTDDPAATTTLREELVPVGPLLALAVARVANQLGPGKRDWRLAPDLDGVELLADRRALYEILMRVLTGAALATGEGDGIQIATASRADDFSLIVQDEGDGLRAAKAGGRARDTRGMGVGLSLAQSLMHAHGGSLTLDSTAGIGTRAMLRFPIERLVARRDPATGRDPVSLASTAVNMLAKTPG
jgi:signal transduction histidine kinase